MPPLLVFTQTQNARPGDEPDRTQKQTLANDDTMERYYTDSRVANPTASVRWRRKFFRRPALRRRLSRYQQINRRSAASWSDAERAYREAYDILSAYPGQLQAIYEGLADAALEAQRGPDA